MVNFYHKKFLLDGKDKKKFNKYLCKFFFVDGITKVTAYTENGKIAVEIDGLTDL